MFPNVRLMIAAMAASVVVLSCGFAVFAAFRINHEPLSRLASGAAPLQLAADNPPPAAVTFAPGQPFGVRFELLQAQIASAAVKVTPPKPAEDVAPANPAVSPVAATEPATVAAEPPQPAPVAQAPAAEARQDEAAMTPSAPPAATTETASTPRPPEQSAPQQTASNEQAAPDMQAPVAQVAPTEQPAPVEQALQEEPKPETTTDKAEPPAPPAKTAHKTVSRKRVAARVSRIRVARTRAVAPANGQTTAALQPNFQSAFPAAAAQPSGIGGPFVPVKRTARYRRPAPPASSPPQ
jgi:hypothetical protein